MLGRAGQGSPGSLEHVVRQGWHPDPAEDPRGGCGAHGSLLAHVITYTTRHLRFGISSSPVTPGVVGALGQQGLELGLDSGSWALCCRQLLQGIYFWPPRDRGGHAVGGRLRDSQELRAISGPGC